MSAQAPVLCVTCKDLHVDFGDADVEREVEMRSLLVLFDSATPWCTCYSQTQCQHGGFCTTLKVAVRGNRKYYIVNLK